MEAFKYSRNFLIKLGQIVADLFVSTLLLINSFSQLFISTLIKGPIIMPKTFNLFMYMFIMLSSLIFSIEYSHAEKTSNQEDGFALELQLGTGNDLLIDNDTALSTSYNGLMFGQKLGKLIWGLGISLDQTALNRTERNYKSERSLTTVLIVPSVRVTFLSSADQKVELFGLLDVGIGMTDILSEESDEEFPDEFDEEEVDPVILDAFTQFGTGVRYWVHPQLALSAHGGIRIEYRRLTHDADPKLPNYTDLNAFESTIHRTGTFTGFSVTGIF